MELDFGPAEPPTQPPANPPPDTPSPAGTPADSAAPQKTPTPTPEPPPRPTPADLSATHAVPVKGKGKGRKVFLILGVIIILAGLGYLGYSFLVPSTPSQQETTDLDETEGLTGLPESLTTTPEATTTLTPTPTAELTPTPTSTPLAGTPAASETVSTRDAIRKKDLATIQTYLESYFNDNGSYPISASLAKLNDSSNAVVTALVPKYTSSVPRDPKDSTFFYGYKSSGGRGYTLSAQLENVTDPEGKQEGSVYLYKVTK